jgi:membrane protein required for colicin V production
MTTLDLVLVVVLAAFAVRGFFRGFVRETAGLAALLAALAGTALYAGPLSKEILSRGWAQAELALVAAGAITFVAIYLAVTLVGWLVDRMARALFLGPVVRATGVVFAIVKGAALLGFALIVGQQWAPAVLSPEQLSESRLAPPMLKLAKALIAEGGEWMTAPGAVG